MIDPSSVLLAALMVTGTPNPLVLSAPDRGASAEVWNVSPTDCESTVRVRDARGVLAEASYLSIDHEHGHCAVAAQWTRDSQYFVYLLENAGGHQGWHTYLWVVSRATRRLIQIQDHPGGPITTFDFRLFGDHSIEFEAGNVMGGHTQPHTVRLDLQTLDTPAKPAAR